MKVALVTGGARGIGLGCVTSLVEAGFHVVVLAHHSDDLSELKQKGEAVSIVVGDVVEKQSRMQALARCQEMGHLEVLVNNAGIAPNPRADVLELDFDSYAKVMAVNLEAPLALAIETAHVMLADQGDTPKMIANITSANARLVSTDRVEYSVSKAGLSAATRVLAARLASEGINVYEIVPGIIETSMTSVVKEKYDRVILETSAVPSRRWGQPKDVGQVLVSLASGAFAYSPGQVLYVDGGLQLHQL